MQKLFVVSLGLFLFGAGPALAKNGQGNFTTWHEEHRPRTLAEACGKGGTVREVAPHGFNSTFELQVTDCNGKVIPGSTMVQSGVGNVDFVVPGEINGVRTADFRNRTISNVHVKPKSFADQTLSEDASSEGAVSVLNVESLFLDTATSTYVFEDVFGQLNSRFDPGFIIGIPDLYADTNLDGEIGAGDLLYSWVDLRVYLTKGPGFTLGDHFTITDGQIDGFDGLWFSATPIYLDPLLGPRPSGGSWYSTPGSGVPASASLGPAPVADAYAYSDHELESIPEPASWALLLSGFLMAGGVLRWSRAKNATTSVSFAR